jgi:hypothetical protein
MIQTSDIQFIRCGLSRLNYLLETISLPLFTYDFPQIIFICKFLGNGNTVYHIM